MVFSGSVKRYIKPILIISLLVVLALAFAGCEDFGQWPPPEPSEPEEKTEEPAPLPTTTTITTEDRVILAVYEHLLSQAEGYQAKVYLANFYATCDNWSAESELFKDGTSVWYVVVDMTGGEGIWREKTYWRQANWLVFQDGRVMPSNRLKANALRIEADLQELSLQPNVTPRGSSGD